MLKNLGNLAMNKKQKELLWIFARLLIIIIPVLLSFLFLFSPFERIPLTKERITENLTLVRVSEEEVFKPSLQTALRDVLEVPFDLKWYEICFVNNDTKLIYQNGDSDSESVNVSVNFNNETVFYIPHGQTKCVTYKFEKNFFYDWSFNYEINLTKMVETSKVYPASVTFHPDVDTYARPENSGIFVKNILFFVAWLGFVFLSIEIFEFIRFGRKIAGKE
ncbi:MAG: hypothetical protein MUP55_02110 [Candidatus Aenigmarchaeota archaeon]|nr:hypothetical protein [Candidatus Aenigmarchaeota archaeon]